MARTRCEQTDRGTDRQTDRQGDSVYTPQTLFAGVMPNMNALDTSEDIAPITVVIMDGQTD